MSRASLLLAPCLALSVSCEGDSGSKDGNSPDSPKPEEVKSECELDEVATLAKGLGALDARARRDGVAEQLPTVCKLPTAVTDYIRFTREAAAPDETSVLKPPDMKTLGNAKSAVCPAAKVVYKQVAEATAADRAGILYDRCELDKFDLIGRADYGRLDGLPMVPFYAFKWLGEQGVPEDQARPIAQALLLSARKDWSLPGVEVPTVAHRLAPVPDGAVVVHVTMDEIEVNDQTLIPLKDGKAVEVRGGGALLGPLYDTLAEEADKTKAMAAAAEEEPALRLVVDATTDLPSQMLIRLVYTAYRAEFRDLFLLAQSGPLDYGVVPLTGPKSGARYRVAIKKQGFSVRNPDDFSIREFGVGAEGSGWDFDALAKEIAAFRADHGDTKAADLSLGDDVPLHAVVTTLATLRGPECESSGTCIFEAINFSSGDTPAHDGPTGLYAMRSGEEAGHFLSSPYGSAFAVGNDDEDVWGGLTGEEVGEAFGVGGLGLVGTGRASGGTGEGTIGLGNTGLIGKGGGGGTGTGFGGSGESIPRVRQAKAKVTGDLDKDIIRRIVRAHINEVRYCYNQGLARDPNLKGRVAVKFTIGPSGDVDDSEVDSSTLSDEDVDNCIAKAVARWKFPKPPGGGNAVVVYPFVLDPG